MGTRHLICVVKNGEYKIAQYGQWDGYPEGQGINILKFLSEEMDKEKFERQVSGLSYMTDAEFNQLWLDHGVNLDNCDGYVSSDVAERFYTKHPELSRDTGSNILSMVQSANKKIKLRNDIDFASDSLFCEWAYVVDLDKNTFEVYQGFNRIPLSLDERFYGIDKRKGEYYPVRHLATFVLNNLPTKDGFFSCFKEDDEE